MTKLNISRRLLTAAELCRGSARIVDVGCDHGKLPVYAVLNGIVPRAVACDINPLPLEKARELVRAAGLGDRISCVLSDGLDEVGLCEGDAVVTAGMGPELIMSVLRGAAERGNPEAVRFIAVPASRHDRLRRSLAGSGFAVDSETAVYENGHFYTVICARFDGVSRVISPAEAAVGLIRPGSDESDGYLLDIRRRSELVSRAPCREEKRLAAGSVVGYVDRLFEEARQNKKTVENAEAYEFKVHGSSD